MNYLLYVSVCIALASSALAQTPAPPETQTPPATPRQPRAAAAVSTLAVQVTDRSGNGLADVHVDVAGPVERSGATGADGAIAFRAMRSGTYRLRFEHEGFITLERELVIRAGQPATVAVALTPAPPKPAAAVPEPAPEPSPARSASPRVVEPRSVSIPDFLDKNLITGGEPQKTTSLACAEGGTARLLQVRDPLNNQQHDDVDEMLYVVAGAGVIRVSNQDIKAGPGFFALVPRGVPHSIRREGRNPIILVSVLAGTPCNDGAAAER